MKKCLQTCEERSVWLSNFTACSYIKCLKNPVVPEHFTLNDYTPPRGLSPGTCLLLPLPAAQFQAGFPAINFSESGVPYLSESVPGNVKFFSWSKIDFILMSSAYCKLVISQHISVAVNFPVVLHHFKWQGPWVFLPYEFQVLSSWSFHLHLAVFVQKHMSKAACW